MTGGGFLFHDKVQQVYAGVFQLTIKERITVKAFGLIATKMPDGSKGYSLIVFITAEDFQPIPIGMGVTSARASAAWSRSIARSMKRRCALACATRRSARCCFPKDPIRNAPEIIRNLITTFPAEEGATSLGLLDEDRHGSSRRSCISISRSWSSSASGCA